MGKTTASKILNGSNLNSIVFEELTPTQQLGIIKLRGLENDMDKKRFIEMMVEGNQDITHLCPKLINLTDCSRLLHCTLDEFRHFNQDISRWDMSDVTDVSEMLWACRNFDQDISGWNFKSVTKVTGFLALVPLRPEYRPSFIGY